jgi:hypothetical protein
LSFQLIYKKDTCQHSGHVDGGYSYASMHHLQRKTFAFKKILAKKEALFSIDAKGRHWSFKHYMSAKKKLRVGAFDQ